MVKGCHKVHLSPTDEDMEGSFDNDVLIGDSRDNAMLGQPGEDIFFGNGGDDMIDARDGVRDNSIQCGRGRCRRRPPKHGRAKGRARPPLDPPSVAVVNTARGLAPHRPLRPDPGQLRRSQPRPPGPRAAGTAHRRLGLPGAARAALSGSAQQSHR